MGGCLCWVATKGYACAAERQASLPTLPGLALSSSLACARSLTLFCHRPPTHAAGTHNKPWFAAGTGAQMSLLTARLLLLLLLLPATRKEARTANCAPAPFPLSRNSLP